MQVFQWKMPLMTDLMVTFSTASSPLSLLYPNKYSIHQWDCSFGRDGTKSRWFGMAWKSRAIVSNTLLSDLRWFWAGKKFSGKNRSRRLIGHQQGGGVHKNHFRIGQNSIFGHPWDWAFKSEDVNENLRHPVRGTFVANVTYVLLFTERIIRCKTVF